MTNFFHKLFRGSIQVAYKDKLDGTHAIVTIAETPLKSPVDRIEQLLSTVGDGTGVTEMVANAAVYKLTPPEGEIYVINRLNMYIEENMSAKFDAAKYGATIALTNGIVVSVEDGSGTVVILTPQPVKRIGHWNLVSGVDTLFTSFPAGASDMVAVRWTFTRGDGALVLNGDDGEFLEYNVQDDLDASGANLVSHIVQAQGFKFSSG